MTRLIFVFAALFGLLSAPKKAPAAPFSNSYIAFDAPSDWKCKPFDVTWVCHSRLARKQKEALIVMMAKEAGALDSLSHYETVLRQPMVIQGLRKGTFLKSKIFHVKTKLIRGHPWVEGFHENSEAPGYYTRYLVTKCCDKSAMKLGIIITLSAHKNFYSKYANDFQKLISSLQIADINKTLKSMKLMGKGENLGGVSKYIEQVMALEGGGAEAQHPEPSETGDLFLLGAGVLIVLILLFAAGRRKKSGKKKKRLKTK